MELVKYNVPQFIYDFLYSLEEKGRAKGTVIRYGYYLEEFCDWIKRTKNTDVTLEVWKSLNKQDYIAYYKDELLQRRHYSKDSIKRVESVLTQLYRFYKEQFPEIVEPAMSLDDHRLVDRTLTEKDFVTEEQFERLVQTMSSLEGLTEHQRKGRPMLINRNISIVTLFYKYGLTMKELLSIQMKDVNFGTNFQNRKYIKIRSDEKGMQEREVELSDQDAALLAQYLNDIPKPVRPKYRSDDPLFVAFDYQRLTYRWVYDNDDELDNGHPKALSRLAVQKMIREEAKRAGKLVEGVTAQRMRNTAILNAIKEGYTDEEIMKKFGLRTPITLRRYREFYRKSKNN
jgi:site-specific recombinase XerD